MRAQIMTLIVGSRVTASPGFTARMARAGLEWAIVKGTIVKLFSLRPRNPITGRAKGELIQYASVQWDNKDSAEPVVLAYLAATE
jgi:hypothetical protein